MAPVCGRCGEGADTLLQQVSVMRREIKNMRQMLDGAVRAHRKQQAAILAAVSEIGISGEQTPPPPPRAAPAALEQGNIQTVPIGYISSCFSEKNGTPRQPTICGPSRAELRLQHSVFNNPEHALLGLEQYSHLWIIFLFHKNGHLSYKAKVKPPRLNGQRVGVYSTRSPHRPNALGLTLAKLDRVVGDTLHLSDIDMIAGTPVLDIKPYIPEYDSPQTRTGVEPCDLNTHQPDVSDGEESNVSNPPPASETHAQSEPGGERTDCDRRGQASADGCGRNVPLTSGGRELRRVLQEVQAFVDHGHLCPSEEEVAASTVKKPTVDRPRFGEEAAGTIAAWIRAPPVGSLEVHFTPRAEMELAEFLPAHQSGPSERAGPRFRFLRSTEEAAAAIRGVLSADPRSVYRRTRCRDKLFFFTLDTADITCWFGPGFAEVLQVRPVEGPPHERRCS